jgi:8-amino-7-oxononanoate synthase
MRDLERALEAELDALARVERRRACPEVDGLPRAHPFVAGRAVTAFCSNDYLGLAAHPALAEAAAAAAHREGSGASASRLVSGDMPSHRALEHALAPFLGTPSALLFPSGYQTNIGVLTALVGSEDLIVSDSLNHASIIDGCRLSRAQVAVYPHADVATAERLLQTGGPFRRRLLVTESVFSMDGDAAPLAALAEAAADADAILVVDEAHALGVLGPGGRGLCAAAGVVPDVLVGTLGKAFGAGGGFAAGVTSLRELLVNRARSFIYTTALAPPVAAAARAALRIIQTPEGDSLRLAVAARRDELADHLRRAGLLGLTPPGAILPVVLGSDGRALEVAKALATRGFFVPAIRPPTVPVGTARLRVTVSAAHTREDVAALAHALTEAAG